MSIETFLLQRYPGSGRPQTMRDEIANACNAFVKSGLADAKFTKEFCSGSDQKFWSCVSEALLAARLRNVGLDPEPSHGGGPDFLVIEDGRKIWVEVICPEPTGVPSEWLTSELGNVVSFPHEPILLRWTSAIKEKAEKLIGSSDGAITGYIEKGIVASGDSYVIAVNGRQLRNGPFPALFGISQFPFAVEAVFALGPYQIRINRDSLEQTGAGHQHRPLILKPKGAPVSAYTFLDARFQPISAIWAVDVDGTSAIGNSEPMAVIHNPNAVNPIPIGFLPAHDEYVAKPIGTEEFELNRIEGCLK
ncbi:MAG: hypothetical protein Q7U03_13115 [Syntrophales bacterium]|nr:hypothetical protein [Syntrophales bacterium]